MSNRIHKADTFMAGLLTRLPDNAAVYRVGGSVRDELLDRKPKDADYVVTDADLGEITDAVTYAGARASKLRLRDGRQIGVRANLRGLGLVEIVLPRTERSTGPLHTDFEIVCDPSVTLAEDAQRRDFTMNALYRDVSTGEIHDPLTTGINAACQRVLETTHPDSFRDDPLRIMRALRFVARGFTLTERTELQMREHASAVTGLTDKGVSGTAFDELCKLLMGDDVATALRLARDTGVLATFLPELAPMIDYAQESRYHDLTVDEHTFEALRIAAGVKASLRVRLSLLFHDSGKPWVAWRGEDDGRLHYYAASFPAEFAVGKDYELMDLADGGMIRSIDHAERSAQIAHGCLGRLNAPAKLRRDVDTLVTRHMVPLSRVRPAKVRKWRTELGDELLADLFKHRLADCLAKGVTVSNDALCAIQKMEKIREEAQRAGVPAATKELPISGHDLMELGLQGPAIGRVQKQLLHEVVSQPKLNDREWLLERAAVLARKEI